MKTLTVEVPESIEAHSFFEGRIEAHSKPMHDHLSQRFKDTDAQSIRFSTRIPCARRATVVSNFKIFCQFVESQVYTVNKTPRTNRKTSFICLPLHHRYKLRSKENK